ncbi:MAG: TOBE domain-containing protein, partial [Chloroflexi bacterium]|nr:TOBE domain-containing protein [Chloroflexota bacterium]
RFVSEFVGSINVLHGLITAVSGTRLTVHHGDHEIHGNAVPEHTLTTGDAVMATVRPEKLTIVAERTNPTHNHWQGRVAAAAYYGDHREYDVEVSDQLLKVITAATQLVDTGTRVLVACDPAEVVVIADNSVGG